MDIVFPTQFSESVREGTKQVFIRPSMTEPDNSLSIPEIIARFTRGQGLQVQQHPWDEGNQSLDDFFNDGEAPAESAPAESAPAESAPAESAPAAGE